MRARDGARHRDGRRRVAVFGAPNDVVRPVFDAKTRLPSRLVCRAPDRTTLAVTPSDRRPTGGLRLPFRVVTTPGRALSANARSRRLSSMRRPANPTSRRSW